LVEFETPKDFFGNKVVQVSDNILITIQDSKGQIRFK